MERPDTAILERRIEYSGEGISVRRLEDNIGLERQRQNQHVEELFGLRNRNEELQSSLQEEMRKLKEISEHLARQREAGLASSWRSFLAKLPFFRDRVITRRSIEELLRRQYELSARRLKEAAEFADRLTAAKEDLYDEIDRLNARIIEAATNEKLAARHVMDLSDLKRELEVSIELCEPGSLEARKLQAELDRARRAIAEHSARLKLYDTAEERLARLKHNTRQLAETITYLQQDITRYVTVASDKLDLIAGQIQAIGVAADASVVLLELRSSLESMTESVNHTTQFVSETQAYFRENVDQMIDDMELYDDETEAVLSSNLALNQIHDEVQIADAISMALSRQIEQAAAQAALRDEEESIEDVEQTVLEQLEQAVAAQAKKR